MKKIILLSDGTGNGAAKRHRTNVWRLYDALDLHRGDQIAYYDDGVGSQEFLLFKLLGGVFGWGLKRNVRQLYTFLCRNYRDGDRIYLFGFSRGAFTVRVLAAFLAHAGLITGCRDERELDTRARRAYADYRTANYHRGYLGKPFRALGRLWSRLFARKRLCAGSETIHPRIHFIGVWDTVDAYGLPIDELAMLWDWLIYPIRFPDHILSAKVDRAAHAVSIDDERLTFHPLLWNEAGDHAARGQPSPQDGRIEQVWFAGVHCDVGGGYPHADLSLVTLDWMISKVEASGAGDDGLHFIAPALERYRLHCDWHGRQHDSRAGFAAYFRYKPRNIEQLSNDPVTGVTIALPKIHEGVMARIGHNAVSYAPTGLPARYEVVTTRGPAQPVESPQDAEKRLQALNAARDIVYWRRWLYAALLATTGVLLASRWALDWEPGGICKDSACAIDPLLNLAIGSLPDFAAGWFEALRQNPTWLWSIVAAFALFLWLKSVALARTRARASAAWATLKGYGQPPAWTPGLTAAIRTTLARFRNLTRWTLAGTVFVLILYLLVAAASQASLYTRSTLGRLCAESDTADTLSGARSVPFDVADPCRGTGIRLEAGRDYRIEVQAAPGTWFDGGFSGGPDGLDAPSPLVHGPWFALRRALGEPWFKLLGRVDNSGNEKLVIGAGLKRYRARSNGELFVYVNDAVFGFLPHWSAPYTWKHGANRGKALITVTPLAAE